MLKLLKNKASWRVTMCARLHRVALIFSVLLLVACGAGPQRDPSRILIGETSFMEERLAYEVEQVMKDKTVASVAITVVDQVGPIYERAFGFADKSKDVAATFDTPYRWGSNSKLFVMLSLLQLESAGKLSLDAPLTSCIPEFTIGPPAPYLPESKDWKLSDITLRKMLVHHSGLPNDIVAGVMTTEPYELSEFVTRMQSMNAQHPADLISSYSNAAYALLGICVERASGQSFNDYVNGHIFRPIGMKGASFRWTQELERTVARAYDQDGVERPFYRVSGYPAGSLMASSREMGLFATALLRGGRGVDGERFVDAELLQSTFERANAHVPLDFDHQQGLSWFLNGRPVARFGPTAQHGGAILSHHSAFIILPDRKLAVLVATNSQTAAGPIQHLADEALALALEVKTGQPTPPVEPPEVAKRESNPSEAELDRWVGHYATVLGAVELQRAGKKLTLEVFGRRFFLKPLADGTMGIWAKAWGVLHLQPGPLRTMRFRLVEKAGRKVVVGEGDQGQRTIAVAYEPTRATPAWQQRVGLYQVVPRKGDHLFVHAFQLYLAPNGQLMGRMLADPTAPGVPPSFALHVLDEHHLVSEGYGRNQGVHIYWKDKDELEFAGLRFRKESPTETSK